LGLRINEVIFVFQINFLPSLLFFPILNSSPPLSCRSLWMGRWSHSGCSACCVPTRVHWWSKAV